MGDQLRHTFGHSHIGVQVVTACFKHKYLVVWIFREAVSQHAACGSCPYNDVVIVFDSSLPVPIKQRIGCFAKVKAFEGLILVFR